MVHGKINEIDHALNLKSTKIRKCANKKSLESKFTQANLHEAAIVASRIARWHGNDQKNLRTQTPAQEKRKSTSTQCIEKENSRNNEVEINMEAYGMRKIQMKYVTNECYLVDLN